MRAGLFQLREQSRAIAVHPARIAVNVAAIPAVAEDRADCIASAPRIRWTRAIEMRRDVENVIRDALAVFGSAGRKHVIADALAVDLKLV